MNGTLITFIVPAYNSDQTLRRCLDSFIHPDLLPLIEIIVVNDGSNDETESIATSYTLEYSSFRIINKENGGHGSVINLACQEAKGKYFKIVDSDDKILTENIAAFIKGLLYSNSDVILTHFQTLDYRNGYVREYRMRDIDYGQEYIFEELWANKKNVASVMHLHGMTYSTEFYRSCELKLTEHISYEDQEFTVIPFAKKPTITPLDVLLEEYSLGNTGQSTSGQSLAKNLPHLEEVFWKLEDASKNLQGAAVDYFFYKRCELLLVCFMAAMLKSPDKRSGRQWVRSLRKQVQARNQVIYSATKRHYYICLLLSLLGFTEDKVARLHKYRLYRIAARFLH